MLHPALYKLMGLQGRSVVRKMLKGIGSPGRIVVFILGAVVCTGWLLSTLLAIKTHRTDPDWVRAAMPLMLLGICMMTAITSAGDRAIAFTPGEVDQLFPGPFTRRELLGYKLLKSSLAAILTALVLSIAMLRHAQWWPACFVGVFMSLLFVQWFSIALLLASQAIGMAAYSRLRKFLLLTAGVLVLIGARNWLFFGLHGGRDAVFAFHASTFGRIVLAPLDPFGQLMTAKSLIQVAKWAPLAAIMNGGLLTIVFLLDSFYVETAMAASERRYAKIQRVRTGSFLSFGVRKTSQRHVPQLPWAGGAGPIIWRQLTNAGRSSLGLLVLLLIVAVGAAPVLVMGGRDGKVLELLMGVLGWLTFLCSSMLNFDFRGDIDHIENLKALPLREWAVATGELVVPVLLLTLFHLLLLGIASTVVHAHRQYLLVAMLLSLPFNAILFGAENLIFLFFPSRPAAVSPGDFQVLGRKFVFLIAKMLILGSTCAVALIPAGVIWTMTGKKLPLATTICWLILAGEAMALVPAIAWAYRRFDPSVHMPT